MHTKQPLGEHLSRSFRDAFRGLRSVWKEERNFRIQLVIALLVLIILKWLRFTYTEIALAIVAITLVLAAETVNTAFEDTLDKIEPNRDPVIGRIKDVAAGIVVMNVIGAALIGIALLLNHYA